MGMGKACTSRRSVTNDDFASLQHFKQNAFSAALMMTYQLFNYSRDH